ALLRVLTDRKRAQAMGEAGRAFVERELTLTHLVDAHDALYRKVISEPVPPLSMNALLPRALIDRSRGERSWRG
ncbi:MAG TPA: hypothetical protein VEY30_06540, partial [Myxococcaceae bacterium]|nr:hypothetical protein [Myxococcaceae bacterium]